jgi:hypothetical protein
MLKGLLYSSLAAAALSASLAPSMAQAQPSCQEQKHDNRVVGTVLGAVGGALLGNAIGEHGGKEGGTIIGGVGGAVAGNAIGGSTVNCSSNQYGYYDENGRWVPNTVTENGYYDANGRWVETPSGSYAAPPSPPAYGQNGGYPSPPPAAYEQGRPYDEQGRPYSDQGRPYGRDSGYPPPAPPAGEYDQNRPYGQQGAYSAAPPPPPGDYGRDAAYGRDAWAGAPMDTREREDWLQTRIQQRIADGQLDDRRGRHALRDLDDIRRMDADYREADGHLNPDQRRDIQERLDTLRASVWADRNQADVRDRD